MSDPTTVTFETENVQYKIPSNKKFSKQTLPKSKLIVH